jgi:hypothetical protein
MYMNIYFIGHSYSKVILEYEKRGWRLEERSRLTEFVICTNSKWKRKANLDVKKAE